MNGKTVWDHLTSLKEINARPNLDILTEYQKWVDEQSDLADAIMGMYQVDVIVGMYQAIPLRVTFSIAVSKLKAQSSNVSFATLL